VTLGQLRRARTRFQRRLAHAHRDGTPPGRTRPRRPPPRRRRRDDPRQRPLGQRRLRLGHRRRRRTRQSRRRPRPRVRPMARRSEA
jgi:hypothetical protein